ncbi:MULTISPECIES: GFA family protein [unclassified Sinorhizobium]|uniref:GFA family protein n=1 Tax=unclassified Sinorhizobium TaxID=2613772 RepID=UPI0035239BFB
MHITGRCHCGFVTYRAEIDPDRVSICHCDDCQRLTGTAYRVSTSARREDVRVLTGKPKIYVKYGDSGAKRLQMFCPECGSPLFTTGQGEDAEKIGIRLGSIDQRRALKPTHQIWCRSALPWVGSIAELPGRDTE